MDVLHERAVAEPLAVIEVLELHLRVEPLVAEGVDFRMALGHPNVPHLSESLHGHVAHRLVSDRTRRSPIVDHIPPFVDERECDLEPAHLGVGSRHHPPK